ncbi:conserved hypothetical protein [Cupriavidus necator]|uniref:Uncharacterized protein n=1 Tax=Cupriavidus necator TaxID=106590 RepID=A0A1K0IR72_CUPNE|nr:conserved hypothetical protein [Cupriavidus necator]
MGNQPVQRLVFGHRDDAIEEADIQRMKTCLQAAGYDASEADIAAAWLYYSEGFAATWLMPPESDQELLADLLRSLDPAPVAPNSRVVLLDVGDGSGDAILELPDALWDALAWKVGDELKIEQQADGTFRLRKIER